MKGRFVLGFCLSLCAGLQATEVKAQAPETCLTGRADNDSAQVTVGNTLTGVQAFLPALTAAWDNTLYDCPDLGGWTATIRTDVDVALGSGDAFGGLTASLEGSAFRFVSGPLAESDDLVAEEAGVAITETIRVGSLGHSFVLSGGVQTDADFQNLSLLVESGYVPIFVNALPGLTVGTAQGDQSRIIVGAYLQGGYTTTLATAADPSVAQVEETAVDSSGGLLRLKLGGSSNLSLPLAVSDIRGVRLVPEAWLWYDVLHNRLYGLLGGTIALDITGSVSYNLLSFKQGGAPPDFSPSTQFSTGLTIRF